MIRINAIVSYLGKIVAFLGLAMAVCIPWSIYYHETKAALAIAAAAAITFISGRLMQTRSPNKTNLTYREGFAVVALGWVVTSLFGTLPYMISGSIPGFAGALFETISGLTTTGSSIYADVEGVPRGILFWRSLTHWIGGMGIIVLFVALIASLGFRANQLFRAEVPGPISEKISPRISDTAKMLWSTYAVMSIAMTVILCILGMPLFDSLCHTFGSLATGGFSIKNNSIAYYNDPLIQWTIIIFMFLSGANFALHYMVWEKRSLRHYAANGEFKMYALIVAAAAGLIMLNLGDFHEGLEPALRNATFQVVSIITTTGFATDDFALWPNVSQAILLVLMLIGGCAGSTAGAVKVGRFQILLAQTAVEVKHLVHPKAISSLRVDNNIILPGMLTNILQFFFLYIIFIVIGTLVMLACNFDIVSSLSGTVSCIGNVGPGLNKFGPMSNYSTVPDVGLYTLSLLMLLGRLEIFPLLLILFPEYWKR